jgi:CheY-like chemotaxis protein
VSVSELPKDAPVALDVLVGLNVLVVEDNGLLCCVLEETLREAGCEVVGPFARLPEALDAVPGTPIDIALLDINIRGEMVSPLADQLSRRGVPFVLTSAYRAGDLPLDLQNAHQLRKPYTCSDVLEHLASIANKKAQEQRVPVTSFE